LSSAGAEVNGLRQNWVWRTKEAIIDTLANQRALCVKGSIQHVTEDFCQQLPVNDPLKYGNKLKRNIRNKTRNPSQDEQLYSQQISNYIRHNPGGLKKEM
jgi:hypothetical protein